MFSSRRLAYGWWREGGKYRYLLLLLRVSLPLLTALLEGPGGPAGAQPPVPLCSLSAPGQLRDPTQAGGASEAGIGGGAEVRGWAPCQAGGREPSGRWVEQSRVQVEKEVMLKGW